MADKRQPRPPETEMADISTSEFLENKLPPQNLPTLTLSASAPPPEVLPYMEVFQKTMEAFLNHFNHRKAISSSSSSSLPATVGAGTRFRLAVFDPDEGENQTKDRLDIDENWMIVRCADALRGRALKYYNHWRPVERNWENFVADFTNAFPDGETHGTRMLRAANTKSSKFNSLTDYAITIIRYLKRFLNDLSWEHILSCVETNLENRSARDIIQARQPANQQELLRLLGQYEAQIKSHGLPDEQRVSKRGRWSVSPRQSGSTDNFVRNNKRGSNFFGKCFRCGKIGHRQIECRVQAQTIDERGDQGNESFKKKSMVPRVVQCVRPARQHQQAPITTILLENKTSTFTFLVDTGAEVSLMREGTANRLNAKVVGDNTFLAAVGSTVSCKGRCLLYVILPQILVEVSFLIVDDSALPGKTEALIGLDVINQPGLTLFKSNGFIDLKYSDVFVPRVANNITVNMSGLAERDQKRLMETLEKHKRCTANTINNWKIIYQIN